MIGRRVLFITTLLLAAGSALAQEEPTVNDSDYDTSAPQDDEAYLDDAEAEANGEPTMSDADFDTSVPAGDESYLDEAQQEADGGAPAGSSDARGTPGAGVALTLGALAAMALTLRRRA